MGEDKPSPKPQPEQIKKTNKLFFTNTKFAGRVGFEVQTMKYTAPGKIWGKFNMKTQEASLQMAQ